VFGAPGEKERRGAAEISRAIAGRKTQISDLLGQMKELGPGAAGVRASIARWSSGLLGQLNRDLGQNVAKLISNATTEELQQLHVSARALIASSIQQLTGEESGRITEAERQLASQALALLEPEASFDQIVAAAEMLSILTELQFERAKVVSGAEPMKLESDEDIIREGARLRSQNLSVESSVRAIEMLRLQQELLKETGVGSGRAGP
jgi:hypothetical protein